MCYPHVTLADLQRELVRPVYLVPVAGETGAVERAYPPPPPPCAGQRQMTDQRNSPRNGCTNRSKSTSKHSRVSSIDWFACLFLLLSSFLFIALTSASPHFPPRSPFRAGVAIPSVALGMYLTLVGLQGDGCERVSREEEEVVRACQVANRQRSKFCCHGLP